MARWGMPTRRPRRRGTGAHVAATQQLGPEYARVHRRLRQPWQERASFFARNLGVTRFAAGLKADSCARCDFVPEKCVDPAADVWEPVDDNLTSDVARRYRGEDVEGRELVRQHVWHYETIGETLQLTTNDDRGHVCYEIRSPFTAQYRGDGVLVRDIPGGTERDGTAELVPYERIKRMWVPDEEWVGYATSPMQAVLRDCERYWALTRSIQRVAESALIRNGLIWYPAEADQQLPVGQQGPGTPGSPNTTLERLFMEFAQRALEDDDIIESVAPFMARWGKDFGPPQFMDMTGAGLDPAALAYIQETLEAIGRGLDYPQRLLIHGAGDGNHWSDWLLEEQFARSSIAPTLERVLWGDLTRSYFRPALRALQARGLFRDDPELYRLGFDMSPIVVHPDQSARALELYNVGALGDTTLLEVSGFDASAAPDRAELGRWIMRTNTLRETVRAPLNPGQTLTTDASTVLAQTPPSSGSNLVGTDQGGVPALPAPATGALPVRSRLAGATVGPLPGEEYGWLDD